MNLQDLRQNYALKSLSETDVSENPFDQFKVWFEEAQASQILEPNAMTLATATKTGHPSARIVLLKEVEAGEFVFYTNYNSQKGKDLEENPQASLLFFWIELQRQIRIEGSITKVSREKAETYFQSRPKGSQIGAWASAQSEIIENRTILEQNAAKITTDFEDVVVLPLPPFWGGFALKPERFEFWQGRQSRLHDRIAYELSNEVWERKRLAP